MKIINKKIIIPQFKVEDDVLRWSICVKKEISDGTDEDTLKKMIINSMDSKLFSQIKNVKWFGFDALPVRNIVQEIENLFLIKEDE